MKKIKYLTNIDFNSALPKETAENYQIVNMVKRTSLIVLTGKFGKIDFSKLTPSLAENLVAKKANFIEKKSK
jgi:hypothetical protein